MGPFKPSRELQLLTDAIRTAQGRAGIHGRPCRTQRAGHLPVPASRRVINIITNRPACGWRWTTGECAAERLMPTDLFSVPSGMILGIITAGERRPNHAATHPVRTFDFGSDRTIFSTLIRACSLPSWACGASAIGPAQWVVAVPSEISVVK